MFWTLLLVARTNSCEILTNSSLLCTNLSDFHLTSSNYIEHIGIHCNGSLPAFAFENFVHLISIELLDCELSEIPWQSLYVNGKTLSVDLRSCPLDCSCTNEWLISSQHYSTYACSFSHCVRGTIMTEPYIECVPGDTITIDVNISANYFSWHMSSAQNNVTENLSKKHVQLVIYAVTEKQLGTISVVCWHCDHPLMTTIELRVRAPLRARLEDRGDSHLIVVSGWPINPINLTIEWSGETETRNLSDEKTVTFFNNLVVRPDTGQSLFYRRVFSVFALACSTCPRSKCFSRTPHGFPPPFLPSRSRVLLSKTPNWDCKPDRSFFKRALFGQLALALPGELGFELECVMSGSCLKKQSRITASLRPSGCSLSSGLRQFSRWHQQITSVFPLPVTLPINIILLFLQQLLCKSLHLRCL
ncbi:unnamed protein product [Haemonchus placei]|uniref:IL17_R_N domain-containing protein n=1 Tax=Haemonchus placei TaxID=6290 RepID=A0A0N4WLD3_HAEPC|nr:unnamed protein product [Haemonchus placei]